MKNRQFDQLSLAHVTINKKCKTRNQKSNTAADSHLQPRATLQEVSRCLSKLWSCSMYGVV